MNRVTWYIFVPALMSLAFFIIATTPVEVFGCRTRGLLALLIAFASGLGALGAAIAGLRGRMRGQVNALWWAVSSLILAIPVVALLLLA